MGTGTFPVRGPLVSNLSTTTLSRPPERAATASNRLTTASRPHPAPRLGSVQDDSECRVPQATSSESIALASATSAGVASGPEWTAGGGAPKAGTAPAKTTARTTREGRAMGAPLRSSTRLFPQQLERVIPRPGPGAVADPEDAHRLQD